MLGELLDVAQDGDGDDGGGCSGGSITLQLTDSGTVRVLCWLAMCVF